MLPAPRAHTPRRHRQPHAHTRPLHTRTPRAQQVDKVGKFTQRVVSELRARLGRLQPRADKAAEAEGPTAEKDALMEVRPALRVGCVVAAFCVARCCAGACAARSCWAAQWPSKRRAGCVCLPPRSQSAALVRVPRPSTPIHTINTT
jgi:hypothetical protein